ncbi:MAG: hypothetical protein C5B49_16110, partial [Bdellovibrio sp.]
RKTEQKNKATAGPPHQFEESHEGEVVFPHFNKEQAGIFQPYHMNNLNKSDPLLSTVSQDLPKEVEIGSFTALNTDRLLYYSFYARIEELIRDNWESAVHSTIEKTPREKFEASLQSVWNTDLEILLRPDGKFHKALLLKGAGIDGFDWAAMDAFSSAKMFPNPHKEMIESDGLVHLRYRFSVHFNPRALVRRSP